MSVSVTAYITAADMVTRYGKRLNALLSGADGNVANADSVLANSRLLAAIEEANATVDAYVRGKHDPADVSDHPTLKRCAMAIAFHSVSSSYRPEVADADQKALDDATRFLEQVASGRVKGLVTLTFEPANRTERLGPPTAVQIAANDTTTDTTWTQSEAFQQW